jgi:hypothetical protein
MSSGLSWKRGLDEALDRRRRFFGRQMPDQVLVRLPVKMDLEKDWQAFEAKWGRHIQGDDRPFPSNEEIFDRALIGLQQRGQVEDDWLPAVYSILDAGESMVGAMFGQPVRFIHRPREPAISSTPPVLSDYAGLKGMAFSPDQQWARRFLSIQEHFEAHADGRLAQYPCLTMDALNFAVEMRGATTAYMDVYEHPAELRELMELGLDFNIRFQEAQFQRIASYRGGCFVWLGEWVPFERAVSLSVDAYVVCSVDTYARLGVEYQARLIEHFGHGLVHFHCQRPDLATEVAKLPGVELFQFGNGPNAPPDIDSLPAMRRAVGDIPIQVACSLDTFRDRLDRGTLMPNVWYVVLGKGLPPDDANRLMEKVRAYRAG